ncbi:MAG: hypothetical protein AB7F43_11530 [Bacteriovoracia bacterium]
MQRFRLIWVLIVIFIFFSAQRRLFAESEKKLKLGAAAVAGSPYPLGVDLRARYERFEFGFGLGTFPLSSFIPSTLLPSTVDLGSGFSLVPNADYSFLSINTFARVYLDDSKTFFVQLMYSYWNAKADVTGYFTYNGISLSGLQVSGTISVAQHNPGIMAGWSFGKTVFFEFAGGLAYPIPKASQVELDRSSQTILEVLPTDVKNQYFAAESKFEKDIDSAVSEFWKKYKLVPLFYAAVGFRFN